MSNSAVYQFYISQ